MRATAISVGHWFHTAAWAFSSGLTWGSRKVSELTKCKIMQKLLCISDLC